LTCFVEVRCGRIIWDISFRIGIVIVYRKERKKRELNDALTPCVWDESLY
jgi:hypothetical protein